MDFQELCLLDSIIIKDCNNIRYVIDLYDVNDTKVRFDTSSTVFFIGKINLYEDRIELELVAFTNHKLVDASGFNGKRSHVFDIVGINLPKNRERYPLTIKIPRFSIENIIFDSKLLEYLLKINVISEEEPGSIDLHGLLPEYEVESKDPKGSNVKVFSFEQ